MRFEELRHMMNAHAKMREGKEHQLDMEVSIALSSPSIGPRAKDSVRAASFGFDWDAGHFILHPTSQLVIKSEREKVWDLAFDHIYTLSLQKSSKGNPTSAAKWAQKVLALAKEQPK